MNDIIDALREAGLTQSETKVYIALLQKGVQTKGPLVKNAQIAASKVYEVTDKLIVKGLVSAVERDGVTTFSAAPPIRIKDYLEKKQAEVQTAQERIDSILPKLLNYASTSGTPDITVFSGWEGMQSVYMQLASTIQKGERIAVLGGNQGAEVDRTTRFFLQYARAVHGRGGGFNIIFNESARPYVAAFEKKLGKTYEKRYLFQGTLTEISIHNDTILILSLEREPFVIRIINRATAASFQQYFDTLWHVAKP